MNIKFNRGSFHSSATGLILGLFAVSGCQQKDTELSFLDNFDRYRVACDTGQTKAINNALSEAQKLLDTAIESLPPKNSTTDQNYKRWFGSPADYGNVKATYSTIQTFMKFQMFWCPNARFPEDDEGTFAWIPSGTSGEIFFEPLFFSSSTSGADSQAGTLIHEVGHASPADLKDSDVTGDGKPDYGISSAEQLARSRPASARNTSDNIQYFAEDMAYDIP